MAKKPRWTKVSHKNGVVTIDLFSWDYFTDFIYDEMLAYNTFIYRGHRCDHWILNSTLDRLLHKRHGNLLEQYQNDQLERFKYAARGRRGPHPPELKSENDWWALGQHNGLATPLLDWTASPYVAAYFAFCNSRTDDTRKRVVFALEQDMVCGKSKQIREAHKGKGKPPVLEFFKPFSDENSRLVNQGGLFTRAPQGVDIEKWVSGQFKGEKNYWVLTKLRIPSSNRDQCLRELNRMNINHLTLFPDLYGASAFCNMDASLETY
jgi:hypothetical protein